MGRSTLFSLVLLTVATLSSLVEGSSFPDHSIHHKRHHDIATYKTIVSRSGQRMKIREENDTMPLKRRVIKRATCTPTTPTCQRTYTSVSGDTCASIATARGMTTAQLTAANPTVNCGATIPTGTPFCITTATDTPPSTGTCTTKYTVVANDYCWLIATNHNLTVDQLIAANPGLNCDTLQVGQELCVATGTGGGGTNPGTPAPTCSTQHTVAAGEYCWLIANNNSLTVEQLTALNPGLNCDALQVGQKLCVAGSSSTTTTTT